MTILDIFRWRPKNRYQPVRSNSKQIRQPFLRSVLCLWIAVWILFIFIAELGIFRWRVQSCAWPKDPSWDATAADTFRLAIIADPQIIDEYSYDQSGAALALTEFYIDIYMIKNYRYLQKIHRPDAILFLGDLFDGGREWEDAQWYPEFKRFKRIFKPVKDYQGHILFMAGNHDIGFGNTLITSARDRFERKISPVNWAVDLGNHTLIALDTLSLSSSDPVVRNTSQSFLDQLAKECK
jgi:hypothetical protein